MYGRPKRVFAPGMKFAVDPADLPEHPFEHRPGSYLQ